MKRKKDKYDRAIAYLKKHPEQIGNAWFITQNGSRIGWPLFEQVSGGTGCPSLIAMSGYVAPTTALTIRMRKDPHLCKTGWGLKINDLSAFAKWQRACDRAARRTK